MSLVNLPSRMQGEVRPVTVKEMRVVTDNTQLDVVQEFLLKNCWTNTINAGPYAVAGDGKPDWNQTLVGDASYALLSVRHATHPNQPLLVPVKCDVLTCRKKFEWEVPIQKYLDEKVKRISDEDFEILKKANRFETIVPGTDKKCFFKMLTVSDQKRLKLTLESKKVGPKVKRDRQNKFADEHLSRIVEFEGVPRKPDAMFDYFESLSLGAADELIAEIDSHDCGLEGDIEIECPFCSEEMVRTLPLGADFLFPKRTARAKETSIAAKAKASSNSDEEESTT